MSQRTAAAPSQGAQDTRNRTGVLLVNLGTPEAPTAQALRPYLRQFLSNPRVVEIPRWIWWPILNGVILPTRPAKSAEKYAQIWTPEGSPLRVYTERQTRLLRETMAARMPVPPAVEYAMSIGSPSIPKTLEELLRQGCDRILVVPLYPQYAASSTAAIFDAVFGYLGSLRDMPALRTVRHYPDHPGYIGELAQNVRDHWAQDGRPDKLVISFHGIPRAAVDKGDPYPEDCRITGRLLARALELGEDDYLISFQSRFGRAEWLTPYTASVLEQLGREGMRRVDVVCPGFVSDCLETLEEIALEGRDVFLRAGGHEYRAIPCLNDRNDWIRALADLVRVHLQGWEAAQVEKED